MPEIKTLVDISDSDAALSGQVDLTLERGHWAATVFQRFDYQSTMKIVDAVAAVAHANARRYAEWAVRETGFGVVEHKTLKNEMTAAPLVDYYRETDLINPRVDEKKKTVEIPRPAGVVFALVPSTNPICTINFKILISLMSRNAIVLSPHPAARECCIDAVKTLAAAAEKAGAPDGVIQIVEEPGIPLIDQFMASPKTSVVLATGGTAMVRAAYSSSNPAIGVGPGNAPVYVDRSANPDSTAKHIIDSKSFDNSVLCTNESVLITLRMIDRQLRQSLQRQGAYLCTNEDVKSLRDLLFHKHGFNVECIGRDALWLANQCGLRVPAATRLLLVPIDRIGVEEKLSYEKLCPVLAYYLCDTEAQAIAAARAVLRLSGAGHSAAIHSTDEQSVVAYANAVEAYRVVVNAPCSQGASGFQTHLPPTFTIGTGYFGRSSLGENIGPEHLVHWTRVAYNSDHREPFGDYSNRGHPFGGLLPEAPSDGVPGSPRPAPSLLADNETDQFESISRAELRQLILEELRLALKSDG